MKIHLIGGVSLSEGTAVEKVHGHRWTLCHKQLGGGRCPKPVVAVALYRGQSQKYGDVTGTVLCADHERELLAIVAAMPGYGGVVAEIPSHVAAHSGEA